MATVSFRQLRQIPLFAELSKDDLRAVAEITEREEYPAGEVLGRQAEAGRRAYFVESGELRVIRIDPQGLKQEVSRMGPGDYFGETSLLLGEPRDATVEVAEDAVLLQLDKEDFDLLLEVRPSVLDRLQVRPEVKRKLRAPRFKWQDSDETVVVSLRKHDLVLLRQLVFPSLVLCLGLVGCFYWFRHPGSILAIVLGVVGILFILASLPFVTYLIMDHRNDSYIVTNKRVVHEERTPFLRESRAEAPLRTIQDIQQLQSGLLASAYDFGDLIIETAGERGHVVFRQIPNPTETRDAIFEQIGRVQAWARAEERAAIRQAMRTHFGLQPDEEQSSEEPPPSTEGRFKLLHWLSTLWRILTFFIPPQRYEQGDTITWRKHWIALIGPIWLPTLLSIIVTLAAIWALFLVPESSMAILIVYGTVMVFLLPWWIWRFDDWQNDVYQVTSTRIIDIERLPFYLREERREAGLDKVQNTNLEIPGFLGKLLRYGSVTIETAGTEPFTFVCVKNPYKVQGEIVRRVEAFQSRLRQQEAERHRAELLDWFSVYDQIRSSSLADQTPSPSQGEG